MLSDLCTGHSARLSLSQGMHMDVIQILKNKRSTVRKKPEWLEMFSFLSKVKLPLPCLRCTIDSPWLHEVSSSLLRSPQNIIGHTCYCGEYFKQVMSLLQHFLKNVSSGGEDKNQRSKKPNVNILTRTWWWKLKLPAGDYGKPVTIMQPSKSHDDMECIHYIGMQAFKHYQEKFNWI